MPSADPGPSGLRYHQLHRLGWSSWPRAVLGVLGMVLALMVVVPVLLTGTYDGILGEPFGELSIDPLTPVGLVLVCLSLAAAVPVVIAATRLAQGLPGGWIISVVGRLRWGWLLTCMGLALLALGGALLLALVLPEHGGAAVEGAVNDATDRTVAFALIILLLIPLQAAGEEYAFRGYLTQAVGGLVAGRAGTAVAVVVPAFLFALAHGAQDAPVFIDRFAFGVVAGVLVIATGGLEAGIAMHVLNNWVVFGLSLAFGNIDEALAPIAGTWWMLPGTLVQSLGYLALVAWVARRRHLETTTREVVLEPKPPRV
ncbi:CPBP family intramembrane glutamic endopeptidase [Nocardioides bizhenqiangii]|uniref:CPBP family intramembrane glutamic endopeptidase n=1 Tax=Nocardioides bizhenqiangii TaxID=3095076 RepID=A0ABZ0ZUK3_9ACTN|nr:MULTISPECIES: CPBP family intramembrane glutamic endopeptidase [unclassified Nocardioides]MDZ5623022.1 CPBP family intramembrane glutamic endopeptidase [Nocardioides sp. HM23]WQQ28003.1 CPBP family intramembrane glutamic endopeptidase [Nocardioides sp. HM61]